MKRRVVLDERGARTQQLVGVVAGRRARRRPLAVRARAARNARGRRARLLHGTRHGPTGARDSARRQRHLRAEPAAVAPRPRREGPVSVHFHSLTLIRLSARVTNCFSDVSNCSCCVYVLP